MNVTFVTVDEPGYVGGPNAWLRRLLPALEARGVRTRTIFVAKPGDTPTHDAVRARGLACHLVRDRYTEDRMKTILRLVRRDPPDVFVPNNLFSALFAARWVKEAGIPTVGILHSDDLFYEAIMDRFLSGPPEWRTMAMVAVSRFLERAALKRAGGEVVVKRLSYGTPVPPAVEARNGGPLRIVYSGRLVERQKKILRLARAFCRTVREVPGTEAVLYGNGREAPLVRGVIDSQGQGLPVKMAGRVDSDGILGALKGAHVFALLSEYEGLPIALMEAMASGLVPVCLPIRSGIPELVEDGVTGLIVPDAEAHFVRAIRRLKEDPSLHARLADAARRRILAEHGEERCADEWAAFLKSLAPAAKPARVTPPSRRVALPPLTRHRWGDVRKYRSKPSSPVTCVAYPFGGNLTETFVRGHLENLPGTVVDLWGGTMPTRTDHRRLYSERFLMRGFREFAKRAFGYDRFYDNALARFLKREEIGVVLAEYGTTAANLLTGCLKARVPLVAHFHGQDAYRYDVLELFYREYGRLFREAAALIVVSRAMEKQLLSLGAPAEKLRLVPYGVNTAFFEGADPAAAPPRFVAVGRFVEKKAPALTLLAFAKVHARVPQATLAMIGDGPLGDSVKEMAEALGISQAVEFPGTIGHEAVAGAMKRARAFVQHSVRAASGDCEGLPVAVLEALASGLPVVATRHAGIPDVVRHADNGFLVEERDVNGMAEAMLELAEDPAAAGAMGESARRTFPEENRMDRAIAALAGVLKAAT